MITHTSTFETLANAPVKTTDVIVVRQTGTPYADDNTMKWTSSTVLMSANIDAVGQMLGATAKKATVKLLGIVSGVLVNDVFQIRLGLSNAGTYEYISEGFFVVETVDYDYDAKSTTVTLYDSVWTAGKTLYSDVVTAGDLTYPATVEAFANMIVSKLGVSLMAEFGLLPNAQYLIPEDLYAEMSNITLQNVIQEIAAATGTTARMSDTTLTFVQYIPSTENLSSGSLKTLKIGNSYGPINSLVLGRVPQNDNIALFTQNLASRTISSVNTTTNVLTSTLHHLADGDMVQFSSTGTLPAPLAANASYYVYTNGSADNFSVVPSYSQATQTQNALSFNGTSSYVALSSNPTSAVNNWTIKGWIKPTLPQTTGFVFYDGSDAGGWGLAVGNTNDTSGSKLVGLYGGVAWIDPSITLTNGVWQHVAMVRRGGTVYFYLNGVETASVTFTPFTPTGSADATIGCQRNGGGTPARFYNGILDDIGVHNVALTAAEILADYNLSYTPYAGSVNRGLVGLWPFNETSGSTTADTSGNNRTGTITGASRVDSRRIIDLTTAGTGTITTVAATAQEIQINNNEIIDDDRADLIAPLYDKLSGIYWTEVKSDTVGLGWHEVGDVISFTQGAVTVRAFLNEIHLSLAGAVKETLISTIPDALDTINYQAAGGILKTLRDAEIKVDHQANEITSIVSEQQVINDQVQTDFTEIRQDVDSIDFNIQNSGGNNLLVNSVGYATDSVTDGAAVTYKKLYLWDYLGLDGLTTAAYTVATHGAVAADDSPPSQNAGGVSGRSIRFNSNYGTGKGVRLTQRVSVAVGTPLSFGVRVYSPGGLGAGTITLSNTNESNVITIDNSAHNWTQYVVENFTTTLPWLDVIIDIKAQQMELSDLTLMYGAAIEKWTQADTELMSTNVQFTKDGIRVFSGLDKQYETRITNTDFQTVRSDDGVVLFEADNTGVRANDFTIRGSSDYFTEGASVIKQITIPYDDPKGGIAFLKGTE